MALDPRIALAARVPDLGRTFNNILSNVASLDAIKQNRLLAPILQQQQEALLTNQQTTSELNQGKVLDERNSRRLQELGVFGSRIKPFLDANDVQGAKNVALNRLTSLAQRIEAGEDVDTTETEQFINLLDTNPQLASRTVDQAINLARQFRGRGQIAAAGTRERQALLQDLKSNDPNVVNSAEVALGLRAPVRLSKEERIALDVPLGEAVVDIEGRKAGAKEEAKLKKKLKFGPLIAKAVKLAEAEATERGEVLTDLSRMNAALPGLNDAIGQLRELAPIATSTLGGRAFDFAVRESGFGATKGATARAKFIAIVNNQVLPLLKPTFGAAFTVPEGDALRATMGDPNLSVDEKLAQLDAFIDQKVRSIETAERQLEQQPSTLSPEEQAELDQLRQLKAQQGL